MNIIIRSFHKLFRKSKSFSHLQEQKQNIDQHEEQSSPKEELNRPMSTPRVEEYLGHVLKDIEVRKKDEEINYLKLLGEEKDEKIKHLENSKKGLESKCKQFEEELEGVKEELSCAAKTMQELNKQLEDQIGKIQQLEKKFQESNHLHSEIAKKDSEVTLLQAAIQMVQIEKKKLEARLEDQNGQIQRLETTIMNLQSGQQGESTTPHHHPLRSTPLLSLYPLRLASRLRIGRGYIVKT